MQIPEHVGVVLKILHDNGFEGYAVGGCVRDELLGRTPSDWDVTTSALPSDMLRIFQSFRLIETGLPHGTVTVLVQGEPIEVTTYRVDGIYSDHRHPDAVQFTCNLKEDLARRDFTVNAMAFHPSEGIRDFFDGQTDLKNRCIRCVGEPERRFHEDALRILRAVRFCAVLGFEAEAQTAAAIRQMAPLLSRIAPERIFTELKKIVCGKYARRVLMDFPQVIAAVFPQGARLTADAAQWRRRVAQMAQSEPVVPVRLAILLRGTEVDFAMKALRSDRKTAEQVRVLAEAGPQLPKVSAETVRRGLRDFGMENWQLYLQMFPKAERNDLESETEAVLRRGDCWSLSQLAVDGRDLEKAGIGPGKAIGQCLHRLLDGVICGELPNERAGLLAACTMYGKEQ